MAENSVIEAATKWMEATANDDSHGYDQINRWGPDYDCSSAVITAWQIAGVPVKSRGATYTGNMYGVFKKCGFEDVTSSVNLATGKGLKRGDVLLNKVHHVAMFCGGMKEVEASINEKGKAIGGLKGDQTGREFLIRRYRNYPWNCVLRYKESASQNVTDTDAIGKVKRQLRSISKEVSQNAAATHFEPSARNGIYFVVNDRKVKSSLMLRTDVKDNANNKIIGRLLPGERVIWYGYYKLDNSGAEWVYVTNGKKTGYCAKAYLR